MKTRRAPAFTIVELLIVIVVIAILATIGIVAYNGIQQRARASEASSALSQAKKKLELYKVDNGSYPTSGNLASAGVSSTDVDYQYTSNGTTYCITGTAGSVSYKVSDSTAPTPGGCSGHGQGGVAAVTNLSTNPSAEANLSGYSGPNGATLTQSNVRSKEGNSSILVNLPTAGSSYVGVNVSLGYSIPTNFKANTTYQFSTWVYVPNGTVNVFLSAQGNGVASSNCGSTVTAIKDAWARLACSFTTTASGSFALYVLNSGGSTAGMQFYVDSIMFTEGPSLYNYADGESSNWTWNSTPNNSTSTGPPL